MSLSVAPASFQLPLPRPRSVVSVVTTRGFADATRKRYVAVDVDDECGTDETYVYQHVRRLDYEMEEEEEEQREESQTRHFTYKYKSLSYDVLHATMDDTCCFCLEEFTRVDAVTTSCGHTFCSTCFDSYKKKTKCPCCRQSVVSLTWYCLAAKKSRKVK